MRLSISKSKNSTSLYVIKSTYKKGVTSSKVVEKLGTVEELREKLNGQDPIEWARKYIADMTKKEKENKCPVLVKYSPTKTIPKGERRTFNGGYLFLQKIYHELGLHKICNEITGKYKFSYDMDSILSRLVYGRVIFPASKRTTHQLAGTFLEPPNFKSHHIYRSLDVIAKEMDFIQAELYKNSSAHYKRNAGIVYYDCTNYFFEIEEGDGLRQYGPSKENRPNPIVEMGLFMDADGIPLAFCIHAGNANEQKTMKPLEKKILADFELSRFVVCTDAGLASNDNRKFNDKPGRAFITTQSIKKLKAHHKKWALDPTGWRLSNDSKIYDITKIDEEACKDKVFYKERWINEDDMEQKLIVTYSIKYRNYQRKIRASQIERAQKLIETNPTKLKKANQNDYKRFIKKTNCTPDGEVAEKEYYSINADTISAEEAFDGFYGVCTNLDEDVTEIVRINSRRWEIEECFRIMKSEFKARPVYLGRDERIKAHFTTCFISLMVYRFLEKKLGEKFTCPEIIDGLRGLNFLQVKDEGYVPSYTRTDFSDALHEAYGFRTDYQIVKNSHMKNIFKITKS